MCTYLYSIVKIQVKLVLVIIQAVGIIIMFFPAWSGGVT